MKLVRFGAPGREKPGMLDAQGRVRDLSKVVPDIAGAALSASGLTKLRKLKPEKLPLVRGTPRVSVFRGGVCVCKNAPRIRCTVKSKSIEYPVLSTMYLLRSQGTQFGIRFSVQSTEYLVLCTQYFTSLQPVRLTNSDRFHAPPRPRTRSHGHARRSARL